MLRAQYLDTLGLWPLPERTPLRAQVIGVIERSDAGNGVRIEKFHFQSRPRLYVTGNLYLPMRLPSGERLPAVLYVCGHWSQAGRNGGKTVPQHHGLWFATHGYVCLIIDTLQLGEIAGIHHGTHHLERWWWQARGYTPAGVECWNGIRAIDYLVSRSEVDAARIAVTGVSGGGAATFWIAAADERVGVAVPVSGMSDLEEYVGNRILNRQCDCMFLPNTYRWPWTTIAALIAPRPLLIENAGRDPYFPMAGNERIRARLECLYRLSTDRPEALFDIAVVPGGHGDGPELRLMAYRWINRHLKGDDAPVTEPEVPPLPGEALRVFPDELPADALNSTVDEWFVPAAQMVLPRKEDEFAAWRERQLGRLRSLSFSVLPDGGGAATPDRAALGVALEERRSAAGYLRTATSVEVAWRYVPAEAVGSEIPARLGKRSGLAGHRLHTVGVLWMIVLDVVVVEPPLTHRDGPIFLNVLRVTDIPEALGLLAPRPLTIETSSPADFERTAQIYRAAGGSATILARVPEAEMASQQQVQQGAVG